MSVHCHVTKISVQNISCKMQPLKLIMLGPVCSGKTTIANFLADAADIPFEYHPTHGVRILEFEMQNIHVNDKCVTKDIELWDCSGDRKFQNCWPAIRKDAQGVIFVYKAADSQDCVKRIQEFYDYFVDQTRLGPERSVIFCYVPDDASQDTPKVVSSAFSKIAHVKCNMENDSGEKKLKADFRSFVDTIMTKFQEYVDREERALMSDNILFSK